MVSTTAWQSTPAVNPGPAATTIGASPIWVPRFRLARMASTTTSGDRGPIQSPAGSASTGMTPCPSRPGTPPRSVKRAATPSTSAVPWRTASEKQTVRRIDVGAGVSQITTAMPLRYRRRAMPVAMSPPPRMMTSMSNYLLAASRRRLDRAAAPPAGAPAP